MKTILIQCIKTYTALISPFLGQNCRFHPTCSSYAQGAIQTHGAIKGTYITLKRIAKCHPFYKGDANDPVPPVNSKQSSPID